MELYFLALLVLMMMIGLGVGFPVAFALPGAALVTIALAAGSGWLFAGDSTAFFGSGSATGEDADEVIPKPNRLASSLRRWVTPEEAREYVPSPSASSTGSGSAGGETS